MRLVHSPRSSVSCVCLSMPTLISSWEVHLTGSVRSSSAPSIQLLKAEALRANCRYSSSTWGQSNVMSCVVT